MPKWVESREYEAPAKTRNALVVRTGRGFSMVDLLVSMSVLVLLMTFLLPSLTAAQESARRVRCAANLRSISQALVMYAFDNEDRLPPSVLGRDDGVRGTEPQNMIFIRLQDEEPRLASVDEKWDGLGILFQQRYLDHPGVFYCPSHHGEHPYSRYAEAFLATSGVIAGNYHFRHSTIQYLSDMDPSTTLLADGMRTKLDYNHRTGNNMFRADLSAPWFTDTGGKLFAKLTDDPSGASAKEAVRFGWLLMDTDDPEEGVPNPVAEVIKPY